MVLNLREERRRRGMSLRKAADAIGVTQRVLQAAEVSAVVPRPENQLKIARFYGFDLLEQWPEPEAEHAAEAVA